MKARLFPRRLVGVITALFLLPISNVYADTYSDDSTFWRWWYVEQITDEMTDGNGVDAENIDDTYNGSTAGEYIYNSTGISADDVKEYVKTQYDNAVGYVDKSIDEYENMIDDIWNATIDVTTKASYQAQKALRETVDTAGNTVVNVSSSSYWGNVYNDLFNNGSYKDQYTTNNNGGYNVTVNNQDFTIEYAGITLLSNLITADSATASAISSVVRETNVYSLDTPVLTSYDYQQNIVVLIKITVGQYSGYVRSYNFRSRFSEYNFVSQSVSMTEYSYTFTYSSDQFTTTQSVLFVTDATQTGSANDPVLQPKQVGYVMHNGVKFPVYTDPSLNPFKVNDVGTVTWDDGSGEEPVYLDPKELTDDGWLNILENVDNSDNTENPYNPFGRPWNTQDDGSALGGFFGNLVKDIGSVFKGLADILSKLFSGLINGILNALSSLFDINYNSITTVQLDVNFNIITTIWQKLLEILGVT